jgi:hypothetical protein
VHGGDDGGVVAVLKLGEGVLQLAGLVRIHKRDGTSVMVPAVSAAPSSHSSFTSVSRMRSRMASERFA